MADVYLNKGNGNYPEPRSFAQIASATTLLLDLTDTGAITAAFASGGSTNSDQSASFDQIKLKATLAGNYALSGVSFDMAASGITKHYVAKSNGDIQVDISPVNGLGTKVGTIYPTAGEIVLDHWIEGFFLPPTPLNFRAIPTAPRGFGPGTSYVGNEVMFRLATAPIRTGSFSLLGTMQDETTFNVTADSNGNIVGTNVVGKINYTTGVVALIFRGVPPSNDAALLQDLTSLGIPGVTSVYLDYVKIDTLRYNAVAFTYLPLDATLLGIDPVRLPTDGKVPIFRPGELAVVGNTKTTTPAVAVVNGTVNCGRTRLSRLRVLDSANHVINSGYTENLETGIVTWTNVTGYAQPVKVEHRVEDLALIRDAQLDGTLTFTRSLTHDYPVPGSYVSSCLRSTDLKSRVSLIFDQASWNGTTYADVLTGDPAPGTFNSAGYPITVSNDGAYTERWALRFKSNMTFDIIGEHVGNIGEGTINSVTAPVNGVTGEPYFIIPVGGWGTGWATGNILRLNTVGAMFPVWMIRTVQQGPESADDYSFLTVVRGDVDNPII